MARRGHTIIYPSQGDRASGVEGPHRLICCFDVGHMERAISATLFRGPAGSAMRIVE